MIQTAHTHLSLSTPNFREDSDDDRVNKGTGSSHIAKLAS